MTKSRAGGGECPQWVESGRSLIDGIAPLMSPPNNTADLFVLLFSTDWFRPYRMVTGFTPKPGNEPAFQHEIRTVVQQMMSDTSCYWDAEFTEERLTRTRESLLGILDRYRSDESNLSLIRALVVGDDHNAAMTEISMKFWDDYEVSLASINRADIAESDWDKQIASFTPDLPSLLQDFVSMTVLGGDVR
jgi:hypothetical protein